VNSDREIVDAIKAAQRLLWHTYDLPDAMKVARLRKFVRSPTVQSALQRCSDTLLAVTLRAVEVVIADQSQTDREMIRRLWDILDYLSGINVESSADFLQNRDADGLTVWIDNYCRQNPPRAITHAINALVDELRSGR